MTLALASGVVAGLLGWWAARGSYRRADDLARLPLRPWPLALAAAGLGLLGGVLAGMSMLAVPTAAWLLYFGAGLVLAVIDVDVHRLPDVLTWSLAGGLMVVLVVECLLRAGQWERLGAAVVTCLIASAATAVLAVFSGLGWGDVKLMLSSSMLAGWAGWQHAVALPLMITFSALPAAVVALAAGRGRDSHLPYGPFIILGTLAAVALPIS